MKQISKNIVIVGYPKSGTTWLTRLVADLLNCPLKGNWGFSDPDQAIIEGIDRQSGFACYKSHHSYDQIFNASKKSVYKIIYLIRDPRDIVISGTSFFGYNYNSTGLKSITGKIISIFNAKIINKKQMIKATLEGNESFNKWCSQSWREHYKPYLNQDVLFIQYEKLVDQPLAECIKILDYLSLQNQNENILQVIDRRVNRKSGPVHGHGQFTGEGGIEADYIGQIGG